MRLAGFVTPWLFGLGPPGAGRAPVVIAAGRFAARSPRTGLLVTRSSRAPWGLVLIDRWPGVA